MTTEADLLAAVADAPDDDAPRLAHAAWLEANGDKDRAEFIRIQVRMAASTHLPFDADLSARAHQVSQRGVWLSGMPRHANLRWDFVRGYPEAVTFFSVVAWQATAAEAFAHPVRHVTFDGLKGAARLAGAAELARVPSLAWAGSDYTGLLAILAAARPAPLRRLAVHEGRDQLPFAALAASPALAGLRSLHLRRNSGRLDEALLRALLESPHLASLEELHLEGWALTGLGAVLWRTPGLPALRSLRLTHVQLAAEDWAALDGAAGLPALESLQAHAGPPAAAAIARASRWGLRRLDLLAAGVGDAGVAALAGAAHLASLERLTLWRSGITDAGAAALATSPHLCSLSSLVLRHNLIGEAGARALGQSESLPALRHLDLFDNPAPAALRSSAEARCRDGLPPIADAAPPAPLPAAPLSTAPAVGEADEDGLVRAILSDPWDELARNVYADWLEERGAVDHAALMRADFARRPALLAPLAERLKEGAPSPFTAELTAEGLLRVKVPVRSLRSKAFERGGPTWMRKNHVAELYPEGRPTDWAGIFNSPAMEHVRGLRLTGFHEAHGLMALTASPRLAGLASLDLMNIGPETQERLHLVTHSASSWSPCRLKVSVGGLTAPRIRQLAGSPMGPHLRNLTVGYLHEGAEGVDAVARSPGLAGLLTLCLDGGLHLSDSAMVALADAPPRALRNLILNVSRIGAAGWDALGASPLLRGLRRLRLHSLNRHDDLRGIARAIAASPHCRLVLPGPNAALAKALGPRLIVEG